jgi:hypothetical protein
MTAFSNYAENKVLDHALGTTSWTMPAQLYVKLHTGDPGEDCTANASSNTTRVAADWNAASAGTAALSNAVTWASWANGTQTISHISLWDHLSTGNPILYGALSTPKQVANGDDLRLDTCAVTVA